GTASSRGGHSTLVSRVRRYRDGSGRRSQRQKFAARLADSHLDPGLVRDQEGDPSAHRGRAQRNEREDDDLEPAAHLPLHCLLTSRFSNTLPLRILPREPISEVIAAALLVHLIRPLDSNGE